MDKKQSRGYFPRYLLYIFCTVGCLFWGYSTFGQVLSLQVSNDHRILGYFIDQASLVHFAESAECLAFVKDTSKANPNDFLNSRLIAYDPRKGTWANGDQLNDLNKFQTRNHKLEIFNNTIEADITSCFPKQILSLLNKTQPQGLVSDCEKAALHFHGLISSPFEIKNNEETEAKKLYSRLIDESETKRHFGDIGTIWEFTGSSFDLIEVSTYPIMLSMYVKSSHVFVYVAPAVGTDKKDFWVYTKNGAGPNSAFQFMRFSVLTKVYPPYQLRFFSRP